MHRKVLIKTWGCQMNVYDSARMADVVAPLGYMQTEDAAEADLVIFNTCHIREKAAEKLFSELGRLRPLKKEKPEMIVAVGGCVAQAEGEEIQKRMPFVDMVFGPQTYHRLPEMLAQIARREGRVLDTDFPPEVKFDYLPETRGGGICAFLSIQEGCDKFCSYCVVPYTRGAEYSRPVGAIVDEAKKLVENGAREITLLGQNVNAYHGEGVGLAGLLEKLAEIPELLRLRYMTSYPSDMDDALIAAHRDNPKLMPYLHLPVQSGSDKILSAMNRKHTADDYRYIVDKLRKARPDIALSSDFIVGFPDEGDADFKETMRLVRNVGFAQAFSFKYSKRPGTPAAAMQKQIADDVKDARLTELQALLNEQQKAFNKSCIGKTMPILVENKSRREGYMFGHSPYLQSVYVDGDAQAGEEVAVEITKAGKNSVVGEVI